jgi:hypothetical protein
VAALKAAKLMLNNGINMDWASGIPSFHFTIEQKLEKLPHCTLASIVQSRRQKSRVEQKSSTLSNLGKSALFS